MHTALFLVATAIARAHDAWLLRLGRRRALAARVARLEERVARLEAENDLLRTRFLRVPSRRRPHYRKHERLAILWHARRHGLSVNRTALAFVRSVPTVVNWHRVARRREPHLLPPIRGLPASWPSSPTASRPSGRAGARAGSRASSRAWA